MKQVVQATRGDDVRVVDVPRPVIGPAEVLVAASRTVISAGTERAVRDIATSSLLAKARARPDLARQVARKMRTDGVVPTMRAVRTRLDQDIALGYSGAGIVEEVGDAVSGLAPGQLVATGGGKKACHAEFQAVASHLAAAVPSGVAAEEAAFATIGAIALHGLRLADLGPGARIGIVGLGLVGQLAVRLAVASGYEVAGIDVRAWTVEKAAQTGARAFLEAGSDTTAAIRDWTRGNGLDAVLVTAATRSSDPVTRAPDISRDRATIVVVGDVGLDLDRRPFYDKELSLRFARSYGPGRYERAYEDWGVDYPPGQVRWTEGRNLEAFLDLLASGRLSVADLVTHRYPVEEAPAAYDLLEDSSEQVLAIQLTYAPDSSKPPVVSVGPKRSGGRAVGLLGAGSFARSTLVPALKEVGLDRLSVVASASGLTARHLAEEAGFERATSSTDLVVSDPDVSIVVVATRHDSHARLVIAALEAGKHVFCEKPLALTEDDLDQVAAAWRKSPGQLMVGFNRRHSPSIAAVRRHFAATTGPLVMTYRVNAGTLPSDHWFHDRRQGGRLLGEVCHFVDTCCALVDAPPDTVWATGSGRGEALLQEDVVVSLRFGDGSVATISYASGGHPSTPKERLEILGRSRSAVVDDYRSLTLDGRAARLGGADKGHVAEMAAFRRAVDEGGDPEALTLPALTSMTATLAAATSLLSGRPVRPEVP